YFPTFNVADMAISVGAVLLVFDSFFGSGRTDDAKAKPEPAEDT
ncbi:MAG: signal peptidase II, partial [Pseudomonadota bacterium]